MKKKAVIVLASVLLVSIIEKSVSTVNSKVIQPEICHTETWTTSYYIDDEREKLYPYIDCKADLYTDGTLKVYFYNTHEWDGFATVKHDVTIVGTLPYSSDGREYAFKTGGVYKFTDDYDNFPIDYKLNGEIVYTHNSAQDRFMDSPDISDKSPNYKFWEQLDLSWYPSDYDYSYSCYNFKADNDVSYIKYFYYNKPVKSNDGSVYYGDGWASEDDVKLFSYYGSMAELPVNKNSVLTFKPKVDVTQEYDFHILSHDIKITPEMLSGDVISTPQEGDSESRIKELEEKVKMLTEENEKLKSGSKFDINGDGTVDVMDLLALKRYLLNLI